MKIKSSLFLLTFIVVVVCSYQLAQAVQSSKPITLTHNLKTRDAGTIQPESNRSKLQEFPPESGPTMFGRIKTPQPNIKLRGYVIAITMVY